MNINIELDKVIDSIKKNPFFSVIIVLMLSTAFFGYLYNDERSRSSSMCDENLKALRDRFTQYQIECNTDLINVRKECRKDFQRQIDSLDNKYFEDFSRQEKQIVKIELELKKIKNKLTTTE